MSSIVPTGDQADLLARQGKVQDGLLLLTNAVARNDGAAMLTLAFWRLSGQFVPRDLAFAREMLRRAREMGNLDAAAIEIALTANGSGGAADWLSAVHLLREAAGRSASAATELNLLQAMQLREDGTPAGELPSERLARNGAVLRFPGFLTRGECEHVASSAADWLEPASVTDPRTGRSIRHPFRTSDGALLGPTRETLPLRAINLRIAAASGTAVEQGEALTVLRYAPGQEFRPHFDSLPHTRNQRTITVLLYLNEGFAGGETVFPSYDLAVRPRAGDAILFTNTLPDGSPDPRARHAGAPVTSGTKWLATRWIRARPFDVWTGPEAA